MSYDQLLLEKSGTSIMSLASPADDSVLELSNPLSPKDEDVGDTRWLGDTVVLLPLYTVVTDSSSRSCVEPPLPPLHVDMFT